MVNKRIIVNRIVDNMRIESTALVYRIIPEYNLNTKKEIVVAPILSKN